MVSDQPVIAVRWHRGVSAALRRRLRGTGVNLGEEAAQAVLAGGGVADSQTGEFVAQVRDQIIAGRFALMKNWVRDHPDTDPYPPSFCEQVLALTSSALAELEIMSDGGDPRKPLMRLAGLAIAERAVDKLATVGFEDGA